MARGAVIGGILILVIILVAAIIVLRPHRVIDEPTVPSSTIPPPVVAPTQDVVLGCYWLTAARGPMPVDKEHTQKLRTFSSENEVVLALESKVVKLQEWIRVRIGTELITTTPGRNTTARTVTAFSKLWTCCGSPAKSAPSKS